MRFFFKQSSEEEIPETSTRWRTFGSVSAVVALWIWVSLVTHLRGTISKMGANIQVQLDRAACNDEFLHIFPETTVEHILTKESDHAALVIRAAASLDAVGHKKQWGFRFEEAWTRHEDYEQMIVRAWEQAKQ